jgi:hypothetical protein
MVMFFRGDLDMGLLKGPPQHSKQRPTQGFVAADGSAYLKCVRPRPSRR